MAHNFWKKARLERSMNGVVEHQLEAVSLLDRGTREAHALRLPPNERRWLGEQPEWALEVFQALEEDSDDTALVIDQVEPFLLALRIVCGLPSWHRWPDFAEGQEAGEIQDWTVGLVRQCVEASAAHCQKKPQHVIWEAGHEAETAKFHQDLRRATSDNRDRLRAARALLPSDKELEKHMRYGTHLDKEYERLTRQLEDCQLARADSLPPPIRIDIKES